MDFKNKFTPYFTNSENDSIKSRDINFDTFA